MTGKRVSLVLGSGGARGLVNPGPRIRGIRACLDPLGDLSHVFPTS